MFKPGAKLYITNGNIINLRSSPEIKPGNAKQVGTIGDPAKGKYLGNYKSSRTVSGRKWVELEGSGIRTFKWVDAQLVTDQQDPGKKGDQCFTMPGITAVLYDRIAPDAKPVLTIKELTQVGTIESTVSSASGTWYRVAAKGYTGAYLYVKQDQVITGDKIKARINQAIANDATLFKSVLVVQSKLIDDQKTGLDTTRAQEAINQYMNRYASRQKMWSDLEAKGDINLDKSFSGQVTTIYNRVRSHFGVGAINWLVVGLAAAGVAIVAGTISIAVYKSWFVSKPTTSSAFDLNKMEEFRRKYDSAKSDSEKKAAMDWLSENVNDYGKDEFDKGEDSGKDQGFLNNLGSGVGKAIIFGTLAAIGIAIAKSN